MCMERVYGGVILFLWHYNTHTHTPHNVSNICSKIEHESEIFISHLKEQLPSLAS